MPSKLLIRSKTCLCYKGFCGNTADYSTLELNADRNNALIFLLSKKSITIKINISTQLL